MFDLGNYGSTAITPQFDSNLNLGQTMAGNQGGASAIPFNATGGAGVVGGTPSFTGLNFDSLGGFGKSLGQNFGALGDSLGGIFGGGGTSGGGGGFGGVAGGIGLAIGGIGSLIGAINGGKQIKLAKDAYNFQKDAYNQDSAIQAKTLNTRMEDRQLSRLSYGDDATDKLYGSLESYMDKNRIKTKKL